MLNGDTISAWVKKQKGRVEGHFHSATRRMEEERPGRQGREKKTKRVEKESR